MESLGTESLPLRTRFEVVACSGAARAGVIQTAHGPIETPAFLPVGTQATVKGLTPRDLKRVQVQALLVNAYHVALRPGERVIQGVGGLHAFMGWDGPIVTDSGGFQVLSLCDLARIDESGVTFRSHLDGGERTLTPEGAVQLQDTLGADIAMALDICLPYPCEPSDLRTGTERTIQWARQCLEARSSPEVALFAIVQGGTDRALRRWCATELAQLPFDGYGIGGLSVGEERSQTWGALEAAIGELPELRPRYLMGVGEPEDLLDAVGRGVDLFDCVLPTRLGRHRSVLTPWGRINLRSSRLPGQLDRLDPDCNCPACTDFSVAYLHHLARSGEDLGLRLASLHNVRFLTRLMEEARLAVLEGRFEEFRATTALQRPGPIHSNTVRL